MTSGTLFQEKGIKPECEIFDVGMLRAVAAYWKKGYLRAPIHFQFCLGVLGGLDATPEALMMLYSEMRKLQAEGALPQECTWSAFGIGKGHLPVMFTALANGGHIRVGMEDNVVYGRDRDGKKIMATNMMLVERAANAVRAYGNEPATPEEARQMLGLKPLDHSVICSALEAITLEWLEEKKQTLEHLSKFSGRPVQGLGGK